MTLYALADVAAAHIPPEVSKDPVRWLSIRLNRKELRGTKFGRVWYMSDAQIAYMLRKYSNDAAVAERDAKPEPAVVQEAGSVAGGLSQRSRRRLKTAS